MSLRNKLIWGLIVLALGVVGISSLYLWQAYDNLYQMESEFLVEINIERKANRLRHIVRDVEHAGLQAGLIGDEFELMQATSKAREFFLVAEKMQQDMEQVGWLQSQLQIVEKLESNYRDILSATLSLYSDTMEQIHIDRQRLEKVRQLTDAFNQELNILVTNTQTHLNGLHGLMVHQSKQSILFHWISIFFFISLVVVVAILLERYLTRPVKKLNEYLRAASESGGG